MSSEMTEYPTASAVRDAGLVIRWPVVTIGLAVVAIGSAGALVVVTTVGKAEVLSTVALALAVISFVAQIIVSLAQAHASGQSLAQAERTHNETRALLASVSARSDALLTNQSDQFDRLLDAAIAPKLIERAIETTIPPVIGDETRVGLNGADVTGVDSNSLAMRLGASIRQELQKAVASTPEGGGSIEPNPYEAFAAELGTFPAREQGLKALESLKKLPPAAVTSLSRRGLWFLRRAELGLEPAGVFYLDSGLGPSTTRLLDAGIYETSDAEPRGGRPMRGIRLSALGRDVVRLLFAQKVAPDWLVEVADGD